MLSNRDFPYFFQVSQLITFYLLCPGDFLELHLLLLFLKKATCFLYNVRWNDLALISQPLTGPHFFVTCNLALGHHRCYDSIK